MNTLDRGKTDTERGSLRIEKSSARESLHDRDPHIVLLTGLIEHRPVRIDPLKSRVKLLRKHRIDILTRRQHIKRRVDTEKDHLYISGFNRLHSYLRIVGAHADVPDHAFFFQLHHIIQIIRVLDLLPLFLRIHIVDHSEIDIVGLQSL